MSDAYQNIVCHEISDINVRYYQNIACHEISDTDITRIHYVTICPI